MGPLGAVDGIDPKPFAIAVVGGLLLSGVAVGATVSNMRNVSAVAASKMAAVTGTSTPNGGDGDVAGDGGAGNATGGAATDAGNGNVSEMQGATGDPNKVSDPSQQQQQQQQVQQVPINQQTTQTSQQPQGPQGAQGTASSETVPIRDASDAASGNGDVVIHVVSSGESIEGLAVKYGSSVEAIISANGLEGASGVPVGTRLVIPVTDPGSADAWGLG